MKGKMVLGLDLGQAADYTAIAIVEQEGERYEARHLERMSLGTPYPEVAAHVKALLESDAVAEDTGLVVDATGVGAPVVDMLRKEGLRPVAIYITSGDKATREGSTFHVPKRDLVSTAAVLLQNKRLKIAADLPQAAALVNELLAFKVKVDPATAHDSYGAWREGTHDDLVLALALALWTMEQIAEPRIRIFDAEKGWLSDEDIRREATEGWVPGTGIE